MKPAEFEYHRPSSLDEALSTMASLGESAKPIAGGQSLVPMMNLRVARPDALVDLGDLDELRRVIEADGWIEVGAMVTHAEVASSERIAAHCPLLARAAASIGHHAIRARGTLGGSIAHADPAAQLPLVAAALDARIEIASARGRRSVPAAEFFVAVMTTVLEPDELVVAVRFPVQAPGERAGFAAFARRSGDFAIVAAAVTVAVSEGRVAAARLALGGVGPVPVVLRELAAAQAGRPADGGWADATADAARRATDVQDELRTPAVYRGELVRTMVSRALRAAIGQEEGRS